MKTEVAKDDLVEKMLEGLKKRLLGKVDQEPSLRALRWQLGRTPSREQLEWCLLFLKVDPDLREEDISVVDLHIDPVQIGGYLIVTAYY